MKTSEIRHNVLTQYIKDNAEGIAKTMEGEEVDIDIIILNSILQRKKEELANRLKEFEIREVRVSICSKAMEWYATIFFDKEKYNHEYGNTNATGLSIAEIAQELITQLTNGQED